MLYRLGLALALALAAGVCVGETTVARSDIPASSVLPTEGDRPIKGMWIWNADLILNTREQDELLGFCQRQGINWLLVQIHYAPGSETPEVTQPQRYVELVAKAADLGIRVEALDGEKSMALAENRPRSLAALQAILDLNQTMPPGKRFVGVHYDILPYLLEGWSAPQRRVVILQDLLNFYAQAGVLVHEFDPDMLLSCDIPFWYDRETSEDGLPLAVEFAGQTKPAQQHIQDLCDYVGIMSYRREAVGPNSITGLAADELAYAGKIGKVICPAVETAEYQDTPAITFHGQPASLFNQNFSRAWKAIEDEPGFGGMLIHCYPYIRDILEPALGDEPPEGTDTDTDRSE
jgi:hypothetical protein